MARGGACTKAHKRAGDVDDDSAISKRNRLANPLWTVDAAIPQINHLASLSSTEIELLSERGMKTFNAFFGHFVCFAAYVITYQNIPTTRFRLMNNPTVDCEHLQKVISVLVEGVPPPYDKRVNIWESDKVNDLFHVSFFNSVSVPYLLSIKIGFWLSNTRKSRKRGELHQLLIETLDGIGFQWAASPSGNESPSG